MLFDHLIKVNVKRYSLFIFQALQQSIELKREKTFSMSIAAIAGQVRPGFTNYRNNFNINLQEALCPVKSFVSWTIFVTIAFFWPMILLAQRALMSFSQNVFFPFLST